YENLGAAVARVGDINGNGGSDFVFTAPNASPGARLYAGSAFVYGSGSAVDPCANDNVAPSLACPSDKQAGCNDAIVFDTPTASDNCDPSPTVSIVSTTETAGPGANEVTHTRTWRATDASGNASATCSQSIVYSCAVDPCASDNVAPTLVCSADKQVGCNDAVVFDTPTASDNCDPSPAVSIVSTTETAGPGANEVTHTRTWRATDASGNASATCSQDIVVFCDQSPQPPRSQLATIESTCDDFVNSAATDLNEVCYSTRKDKISKCTPGSFYYFVSFTAPSANFVMDIVQTRDGTFFPFFDVFSGGINVLDGCASVGTGVSNSPGQAQIVFSGATAGKQYVVAVEYNAATLNGIYVDPTTSVQHHDFSAWIAGAEITNDYDGLTVLGCGPKGSRKGPNKVSSTNYPNPFNPSTEISYYIEQDADVSVEIYNMLGQRIITLVDEFAVAGDHIVTWNGTSESGAPVATGVYFLKVTALDEVSVTKMNLLK
ncbi:MAG TPA: FlgD immunoglobulin-like domain containing protein, partial [candidate division Zixibacteria bacterium]|nr:FlgD immunoglobulin-like domain containing protein [candidate division Zixibacteria bacterium]